MYTRPWRSSPLAGPAFSTLPPIISESSEEEHDPENAQGLAHSRSPSALSIVSQVSVSLSGYGSRNPSRSGSAVLLVEGEASTSSISLLPSTSVHGTSSSQGHGSSQTRPNRLSKPVGHRATSPQPDVPPKNVSEVSITPPPRARTISRGSSHPGTTVIPPPSIPPTYSRISPPPSEPNMAKQSPSTSRDPSSNWMSSTPFGPPATPKFSRLAMASPAVVMPLSAREYRKQKAKEALGKGKEKDVDNAMSAFQGPNGLPLVKVSSPPSGEPSSRDHQHQVDPASKPSPHTSLSPQPQLRSSHTRPRSRPTTPPPPRSSPLVAHPPISPKSSAATFYSFLSISDDEGADDPNAAPARPRPRPLRRKSYPDRLSNGARLSLLEAMNRLSQENTALHRLSVASQASGHTLFYDVDMDEERGNDNDNDNDNEGGNAAGQLTSVLHTQSLEDLSSTLARTGIEVVRSDGEGNLGGPLDDERKGKRNVRVVRISDTVEVSPAPAHRRRKLTKSRPGSIRRSAQGTGTVKEPTQDRRASLLPWRSKGSSESKGGVVGEKSSVDGPSSTSTKSVVHANETAALPSTHNGSAHVEDHSKPGSRGIPTQKTSPTPPKSSPSPSPRKDRRYTFSFLSPSTFPRPKREKSNSLPASVNLGLGKNTEIKPVGALKGVESGTDSASTSIRTITPGSESTLTPASSGFYDLTTPASSGGLSAARQSSSASIVPMLRRLNAQEMDLENAGALERSGWNGKGSSTPSLITNGSTGTTSSGPRTPSFVRPSGGVGGGEPFVPRPSALKESFTDMQGTGRTSRMSRHRKVDQSPLARGAETSEEEEQVHVHVHFRASSSPGLLSPSPRPGTSSSSLTSASYASFSTVPASTVSSSSTSRSTSPSPVRGEKREQGRDRVLLASQVEDEDEVHACTMCGHVSRSTSPTSERMVMHPMFTVPLVTVPALAVSYPRSAHDFNTRLAGRRGERQSSMVVPAGPKSDHGHHHGLSHMHGAVMKRVELASPPKVKKRRRPQTAPAGTGDLTFKFIEETKAGNLNGVADCATKPKGFKAVLKGLLRWNA